MLIWRSVSSCKACFQILHRLNYSTVTSSTTDSYVSYLVDSFSFSRQQALSVSNNLTLRRKTNKVIDSKFVENANSVGTLFRNLGFDETHIMSKEPRLLASKVDATLKPKIKALQNEDFSASDIIRVISRRPKMLLFGLESTILPAIHNLKQVMGSVDNVVQAIQRINKNYFRDIVKCLLPNVALLNSCGLPIDLIRKQLLNQPWYYLRNPEIFKDIVIRTPKKLEITRYLAIQVYAINVISGMCEETFESESQIFRSFGAKYLVDSFGFSHEQALSISTKLIKLSKNKVYYFNYFANANSVVTLFRNLGFQEADIRKIVSKQPRLLASKVDKTLKTKIRALQDEDFSGSDIVRVISKFPAILLLSLESTLLPSIHILKQVMGSVSNVIGTIESLSECYFRNIVRSLLPNVALLTSYRVPIERIREQMLYQPRCYLQNPEVFEDIMMRLEKSGVARDSPVFLYCIQLPHKRSMETIVSNIQILKSFGWTHSDIETFIIKNGSRFSFSDGRIKKKLDFLMNEIQLMPASLITRNCFLSCSLEKRIAPRHKILLILKEKGLLKMTPSLYTVIQMSEPCFLKRFVLPFKEVHQTYAKLTGYTVIV